MSFDPTKPFKMVDGVHVNITEDALAIIEAQQSTWVAEQVAQPIPDLATQLAAALINNGVLQPTDIQPDTLATINQTLTTAKLSPIAVSAQPAKLA